MSYFSPAADQDMGISVIGHNVNRGGHNNSMGRQEPAGNLSRQRVETETGYPAAQRMQSEMGYPAAQRMQAEMGYPAAQRMQSEIGYPAAQRMQSEMAYRLRGPLYDGNMGRKNFKNDDILSNGFDFYRPSFPTMPNSAPGDIYRPDPSNYRNQLDEAYHYFGQQNPLDPNLAQGSLSSYPLFQIPRQATSQPSYGIDQNGQMAPQYPPHQVSAPKQYPVNTFPPNNGNSRYPPGDDGRNVVDDKKKQYQDALQKQIDERKLKKLRDKEENERYEMKIEQEVEKYSVVGQGTSGGGGAPMRDNFGNILTTRRHAPQGQQNQNDMSGASNQRPVQRLSAGDIAWETSPQDQVEVYRPMPSNPDQHHHDAGDISSHARGGHGVFGQPMSDQQKSSQSKYQDDLLKQIEDKKMRQQQEKEKVELEEQKMLRKIEEDNIRIAKEAEEEKRKAKEKEEAAERQRQELKRQQDEDKQAAERKRQDQKDAREAARRKEEELSRAQAAERERIKSPPINANLNSSRRQDNSVRNERPTSPPVPVKRTQSRQSRQTPTQNAEVLSHLAKMKHQLHSERLRVESALKQNEAESEAYDPNLAHRRRQNRQYNPEVFEMAVNKGPVTVRRPTADPLRNPRTANGATQPDELDMQDRRNMQHGPRNPPKGIIGQAPYVRREDSRQDLKSPLEAKSTFLEYPGSRAENYPFPDDFEDMHQLRNESSRNRRHRLSVAPVKEHKSFDRPDSVVSLDPDELKKKKVPTATLR